MDRNSTDPKELLMYWITERERVRYYKEKGFPKPWSLDPVFQQTYFCNVRREDDKVTKWIRDFYSTFVGDSLFEFNMILARFLNYPPTLKQVGYIGYYDEVKLYETLERLASEGKVWGNAYVITTHGIPMGKAQYLCKNVLLGALQGLGAVRAACRGNGSGPTLRGSHASLMRLEGLGSFLAAQVVADLKNTYGHPLREASDWATFVAPGPGSVRGVSWFHHGAPGLIPVTQFMWNFMKVRDYVDEHWDCTKMGQPICNQDLQNCLCEYDKFMRVRNGTGRSKRNYNGSRD